MALRTNNRTGTSARPTTMALSILAERLVPRSHRECQTSEFRMKWKFASTSDVRDPGHSESRLARFKNSHEAGLLGPVHCAISECKRSENKLRGMNTCTKKVGGTPPCKTGFPRRSGGVGLADCKSLGGGTRMGWVRRTVLGDAACS